VTEYSEDRSMSGHPPNDGCTSRSFSAISSAGRNRRKLVVRVCSTDRERIMTWRLCPTPPYKLCC
jgi:hypothetical protein